MGNDDLQAMSLKTTFVARCLDFFSSKKFRKLAIAIFFPWKSLWDFRIVTQRLHKENIQLSEKVSNLRNNNARLILQHDLAWRVSADEISGLLNWPEITNDIERTNGFTELIRILSIFSDKSTASKPSFCWTLLAAKNCDQLLTDGFKNFKRTIGHNYFNFLVQKGDSQIQAAEALFSAEILEHCQHKAQATPTDPNFNTKEQYSYYYFLFLLWEYAKKIDTRHYLDVLKEPLEGNPILVSDQNAHMSQDLANSLIEYYSICEGVAFKNVRTVLEIGGGYGRNAYVISKLNPNIRIVLVDIWPALYVAQRYLSSVLKEHNIFKAVNFSSYNEVKDELESANLIFLLPHQLALLPDKYFNLCINISSFGEMKTDQIQWYFEQINRLTCGYFYTKQWNVSQNPFDGLVLRKEDYPYPTNWREIYSRNCIIQTDFFESLYQVVNK